MIAALADRTVVLGLVAAVGFCSGWQVNGWRLGEGIESDRADGVTIVRVVERKQQEIADTEGGKGDEELERLRRDAAGQRAAADRLRAEARSLATGLAACAASTAGERAAREAAAGVLADVLGGMAAEGGRLAEIADGARSRGSTCERIYDGVRQQQNQQ